MVYDVGIDIGSVSINCIVIDDRQKIVYEAPYVRHLGLIHEETRRVLQKIAGLFPPDRIRCLSFTGVHGQLISRLLGAPYEVETIAQVLGAVHMAPGVRTIVSVGGQDAALFQLSHNNGSWHLDSFIMNGPCASGTGSFIDQQAERLASSIYGADFHYDHQKVQQTLDDFIALGLDSSSPAPVACRCTVFTKSDMIHLQNKGEHLSDIIAGLHYGNAANYFSTLVGTRELSSPAVFIGGVASNDLQFRAFHHYLPRLEKAPHHASLGALGAALQAQKMGWEKSFDLSGLENGSSHSRNKLPKAGRLELKLTEFPADNSLDYAFGEENGPIEAYLGIDIGSTTTKYALIDTDGAILHKHYVQTQGKPIEVARGLIRTLRGEVDGRIRLRGIATTGSGRNVVGEFLDADLIIDEITAHARGAVEIDPAIDTIFEIGGQDSKYISLDATHPLDFDMNKVCAAGTGSFLHELASKMNINIAGQFQEVAMAAEDPVNLADRCTVFMESDLVSYLQKGAAPEDLVAGLCYAVVHNYLNRVVGKKPIGRRVMFLGGPSLNKAVVAAFEKVLGQPLIVPRHREVLGACGAAHALRDMVHQGLLQKSERDLGDLVGPEIEFKESICRVDRKCHNECKLKIYSFGERKGIWGGDCGRYESGDRSAAPQPNLFKERQELFEELLEGRALRAGDQDSSGKPGSGKTVGIPLALHHLEWSLFWVHILSDLGYRVILSPPTDQKLVMKGVESMTAETCFPVKVLHGHVKHLLELADYIFLPNLINAPTPIPREHGQFCPFVGGSQYVVKAALGIPESRLISPTLFLKDSLEEITDSFHSGLPGRRKPGRGAVYSALEKAWAKQLLFRDRMKMRGESLLEETPEEEPVWIVTGRSYNLYDERCNLRLGKHLAKLGIRAVPMDFLDLEQESLDDFPNMYWGSGSRILRAGRRIARTPNFHGVHLTNFACGVDSFVEHFYRQILGEKPALILELDEHSAAAGLLTRLEAYRNVVRNLQIRSRSPIQAGI